MAPDLRNIDTEQTPAHAIIHFAGVLLCIAIYC